MHQVQEMQDFAYRHLKDYTDSCQIQRVYAMTDTGSYVVIIGDEADSQVVPPIIWRQLRNRAVTVKKASTYTKVVINESTYVCYQNERWVR